MLRTLKPQLVELGERAATDPELTGGKAAALALAASAGLPTLGGVILTTEFSGDVDRGTAIATSDAVLKAFDRARGDDQTLVARSSSVIEDAADSSMAGQFQSVIGIRGFDEFQTAVSAVLDSRARVGVDSEPMAVLIQPLIEPAFGGVLFGVDPVTGRSDRLVISAVTGGPEPLVSGRVEGAQYVVDANGHILEFSRRDDAALTQGMISRLVRLAEQVATLFDGPQDVEWAIGHDGQLWLLQSRPVTTKVRGVPSGPIYGPGPVAETFPEPLSELEADLWVPPLREGVRHALHLSGAASDGDLDRSEVVICVDGHVAIDLRLAGEMPDKPSALTRVNPLPSLRRLGGAWRVGRLRGALPLLAEGLLDRVDADLVAVPPVGELTSRQLVALLHRGRSVLRALHAHEILMGLLTNTGKSQLTGASVALRILSEARRDGLTDDQILAASPVVLALTGPRIAPAATLPADSQAPEIHATEAGPGPDAGVLREALRLRARWMQELTGRAAWKLGERLAAAGDLPTASSVRHLSLDDLEAVITKRANTLPNLIATHEHDDGEPLPACFQISDLGLPIGVRRGKEQGGGTGAGGGVGRGPVTFDSADPPIGSVLVVRNLSPGLGPLLPRLAGIVAETGSVLSHLAILAREGHVPTVVGYAGATSTFDEGIVIEVNGDSGDVTIASEDLP